MPGEVKRNRDKLFLQKKIKELVISMSWKQRFVVLLKATSRIRENYFRDFKDLACSAEPKTNRTFFVYMNNVNTAKRCHTDVQ